MITLYCSSNQNQGEFEHFLLYLENLLGNIRNQDPSLTILLDEFNDRPKIWWVHDITNNEDTQIESISLLYGFSQLISDKHTFSKMHHPALTFFFQIKPIL